MEAKISDDFIVNIQDVLSAAYETPPAESPDMDGVQKEAAKE